MLRGADKRLSLGPLTDVFGPGGFASPPLARRRILGPLSPEFSISSLCAIHDAVASSAWAAANDPIALAFRLSDAMVVEQLGWANGTSAGGNIDVGIYTASWVRLVSTGSQASTGNNAVQWVDVTDTALLPNTQYYLVGARDNATANRQRTHNMSTLAVGHALSGSYDSTTDAFPLPDPLTDMALATAFTVCPVLLMAGRAPF